MMKKTINQFVLSAVFGIISSIVALSTSYILDHITDDRISNIISLFFGYSVDFLFQKYIFTDHLKNLNSVLLTKYTITVISTILLTQILFMYVREYARKYKKEWYDKHWKVPKTLLIVRYITKAIAYGMLEFPLNKIWVFKIN